VRHHPLSTSLSRFHPSFTLLHYLSSITTMAGDKEQLVSMGFDSARIDCKLQCPLACLQELTIKGR